MGILKRLPHTWEELRDSEADLWIGSEHFVELSPQDERYHKVTIPPAFGLVPMVREFVEPLRFGEWDVRRAIEFVPATPLEYLSRWQMANELFGDDVRVASVVEWSNGALSFGITQPQYHGEPAEARDIEGFFVRAGWARLKDPSGHLVFFNYAFGVMAIDAVSRNCYITEGELQPFDVILCRPDETLEDYLKIFPGQ